MVNQDTSRIMSVTLWGLALCEVEAMLFDLELHQPSHLERSLSGRCLPDTSATD